MRTKRRYLLLFAGGAAVMLTLTVLGILWPPAVLPVALVGVAALTGVAAAFTHRTSHQAATSPDADRQLTDNNAETSRSFVPDRPDAGLPVSPPQEDPAPELRACSSQDVTSEAPETRPTSTSETAEVAKLHPGVSDLLATGAFSTDFYRAVTGRKFTDPTAAADHYLTWGMPTLTPPNPFVELSAIPETVQQDMLAGDHQSLVDLLVSPDVRSFGSTFDVSQLAPELLMTDQEDGPVGPLGRFLGHLDADVTLPVAETSEYHGRRVVDHVEQLSSVVRVMARERWVRRPRPTKKWDLDAEARWKQAVAAFDPPTLPQVTVVMPVRNRLDYVGAAIASVRQQSYSNWELNIVDDHSDDGTWEFIQAIAEGDSRINIMRNDRRGVSAARNTGMHSGHGELFAFLDSDNQWRPDYLELMVKAMARDELGAAYAASRISYGGNKWHRYMAYKGGRDHLLFRNHIDLNVLMIDRGLAEQVGGFDEQLRRWVDHDFAIRLFEFTEPVLLPFIGCDYEHDKERPDRISVSESDHWRWVVFNKALVDWQTVAETDRVPGRLSVIIPTYEDHLMTLRTVDWVLADPGLPDVEVLVVDNGSSRGHALALAQGLTGRARVRLLRLVQNYNFAIGCNYGFAHASGEYAMFLNNDTLLRRGTLADLLPALNDPHVAGVQPLVVRSDDTIESAGVVFPADDALPIHLLATHPTEDALNLRQSRLSSASGVAVVLRASDVVAQRGFDPFFVNGLEDIDLCLRLLDSRPGGFRLSPDVVITHLKNKTPGRGDASYANREIFLERWRGSLPAAETSLYREAGFELARVGSAGGRGPVLAPKVTLIRTKNHPRRWGIKSPANAGIRGDRWGDTHFASSLATSLVSLGQQVVTYRHEAHNVEPTGLDDVSFVLRGLDRVRPIPGQRNVMWIISHPERVTPQELQGFDLVYAASEHWAAQKSAAWGIEIRPLLQCTDPRLFHFSEVADPDLDLIFVGGNHTRRDRKVVHQAIESGVSFCVWGPRWEGVIPAANLGGDYVPNAELAAAYQRARFVLADHWAQMADEGFIQNRIFDALASGRPVLTDPVAGIDKVFGDEVRVVRGPDDIAQAVTSAKATPPDPAELRRIADTVAHEHSFDARAQQLVRDVAAL